MVGRVLYLDLDTVLSGSLDDIAGYSGSFAALSVEGMSNERRPTGLNSSVMSWDAGREATTVQAVHGLLKEAYKVVSATATTGCTGSLGKCWTQDSGMQQNAWEGAGNLLPCVEVGIECVRINAWQLTPALTDVIPPSRSLFCRPLSTTTQVTACVHKLDHWLEMTVPGATTLQHTFPGQIVEYNSMRAAVAEEDAGSDNNMLSRDARIVCFPLEPKPHQVNEDWLQQLWRGGDGGGGGGRSRSTVDSAVDSINDVCC